MRYKPMTKEELAAQRGTLKAGPCDFEVVDAKDQLSKAGNEMVKLTLRVWDSEGREGQLFDYLVGSASWKIASFFESIGNPEHYESGEIDTLAILGACGKATLAIEKDTTGKYGDQAKVKFYVKPGEAKKEPKNPDDVRQDGDDIPF